MSIWRRAAFIGVLVMAILAGAASAVSPGSISVISPIARVTVRGANDSVGMRVTFDGRASSCQAPCRYVWRERGPRRILKSIGRRRSLIRFTFRHNGAKDVSLTVINAVGSATAEADFRIRRGTTITPPAPTTTPSQPAGQILWSADATHPIDQEWASYHTTAHCAQITAPGVTDPRIYQVADSSAPHGRAYQADYVPSSVTGCYCYPNVCREEVGQDNPPKTFADGIDRRWHVGQDVWISFEVKLQAPFSGGIGGTGATILQFTHPTGNGAPPWGLAAGGPGPGGATSWSFWGITANSQNHSTNNYVGAFAPDVGRWVKFSVHIHMAQDSTGDFEAYSNLANPSGPLSLVFSMPHRFTMSSNSPTAFMTLGNYVATSPPFAIHYEVAGLTVASDRVSAELAAFG